MLRSGRVVLEITPPRKPDPAVLLRRAEALAGSADAVNVIQRTGRMSSLDASLVLADAGMSPVWHLTTRGRTEPTIRQELQRAALGALPAVLCLRGDHDAPDVPERLTLRECVALARALLPNARVGVTLNPYIQGEGVWKNLLGKLEAGAHFVQTQPVFETDTLRPFAEAIRESFPSVDVLPMVMPLTNEQVACHLSQRLAIPISPEAVGMKPFEQIVRQLARDPLYAGFAVMTPQMDPSPEMMRQIGIILEGLH